VLAAKCLSCHGPTPMNGAPNSLATRDDLRVLSSFGETFGARSLVRMKDPRFPMPPAYFGMRPPAADAAAFEAWVTAGMPLGSCSSVP
jgi:hypothetical protein